MSTFFYRAKSDPASIVEGFIEAETKEKAASQLNQKGYFVLFIKKSKSHQRMFLGNKVSLQELIIFYEQLINLINSGINLLNALNIILGQLNNKFFFHILNDVIFQIKNGKSFSESLSNYSDIFGKINIAFIKSGESSGNLEEALRYAVTYLEKEKFLKDKFKEAFIYPAFIIGVGFFSLFIIFNFVIPRLTLIFQDLNQVLPLPTQILINISKIVKDYKWFIVFIIFILIIFFKNIKKIPKVKYFFDKWKLKIPFCNKIIQKIEMLRFTQTMYLLLSSGVNIISSLELSCGVIDNEGIKKEFKQIRQKIIGGMNFSGALRDLKFIPAFVLSIIKSGEESGSIEESLSKITNIFEKELNQSLGIFIKLLEPIIILFMGLVVGFIVISILLPIFQMNLIIK